MEGFDGGRAEPALSLAISWQELLSLLSSPNELPVWVREKHRLL